MAYSNNQLVEQWAQDQLTDTPDDRAALRAVSRLCEFDVSRHDNKDDNAIHGMSTADRYLGAMRQVSEAMRAWDDRADGTRNGIGKLTVTQGNQVLEQLSGDYEQKSLNLMTRAVELHLRNLHNDPSIKLDRCQSEIPTITTSRAYTDNQTRLLMNNATERLSLSIEIARSCGLRAAGLHEIRRLDERGPTARRYPENSYKERDGYQTYTVSEKGGLVRPIFIKDELAARLEATRLDTPRTVYDRDRLIKDHYELIGGNRFSSSITRLSNNVLGYSNGAHGLRHSFAQQRMTVLQNSGLSRNDAKLQLSRELGHFRASIVDAYLR